MILMILMALTILMIVILNNAVYCILLMTLMILDIHPPG